MGLASPSASPLASSPLIERGGWRLLDDWPTGDSCKALLAEATRLRPGAERTESTRPDPEDLRGGDPPRGFGSVPAGEAQATLYQAQDLWRLLEREVGERIRPSAERGTYSYYERVGDHLGIHRDVVDCDVTLVTCLCDQAQPGWDTGAVAMWPGRLDAPLSAVRLAPEREPVRVRLAVGESLLVCGAVLPHAVLPVAEGQDLILSVLCFRLEVD